MRIIGVLCVSALFLTGCFSDESSVTCVDDTMCARSQYCDMTEPVFNEITQREEGFCVNRPTCDPASGEYCPDGWECAGDGFCDRIENDDRDDADDTAADPDIVPDDGTIDDASDNDFEVTVDEDMAVPDTQSGQDSDVTIVDTDTDVISDEDDSIDDTDTLPDTDVPADDDIFPADADVVYPDDDGMSDDNAELPDTDSGGPETLALFDFNDGAQNWAHERVGPNNNSWRYDSWEQGDASAGPGSCYEGAGCFGMDLDNNYINCERAVLTSPIVDLSTATGMTVTLSVAHWYDFWQDSGYSDGGTVEISGDGGSTWTVPTDISFPETLSIDGGSGFYTCDTNDFYVDGKNGFSGDVTDWETVTTVIDQSLLTATFQVRFIYNTGVSESGTSQNPSNYSHAGWYIDMVQIIAE